MKKILVVLGSIALLIVLTACSGGVSEADRVTLTETYEGALSVQVQLLIGTIKLEETDLAVKDPLTSELIPLWQVVRNLSGSGTAADAEVAAVIDQIQDMMTAEQLQAITAMELTQDDVFSLVHELGLLVNPGGNLSDNPDFVPPEGGFPESIPEGAPEGFAQDMSPEEIAALQQRGVKAPTSRIV
jgi:hypothetical protein